MANIIAPDTKSELTRFSKLKFIDVSLPGDTGRISREGGFEKLESRAYMDETARRFQDQISDPRAQDPRLEEEMKAAWKLNPDDVLSQDVDFNSLSYIETLIWEKRFRRAAQNGAKSANVTDNAKADECWRRAMLCGIRAFTIEKKDLILLFLLDDYYENGLTKKFPDETARLLEAGLKMNSEPRGNIQLKFLEKYYEFQSARGKLDEVVDFLLENNTVLMGLKIMQSRVLQDLLKKHPRGEQIRHSLSKSYFGIMKMHTPLIDLPDDYNAPKRPDMNTHMISYELALNGGNYREVEKVLGDKKAIAMKRFNPEVISRNVQALVPEYYSEEDSTTENPLRIRNGMMSSVDAILEDASSAKDADSAIKAVVKLYDGHIISYDTFRSGLVRFLRAYAGPDTCEPAKIIESLQKLFEAEEGGELKIPTDLKNIANARLVEACYSSGNFAEAVNVGRKIFSNDAQDRPVRGAAYFYAKACFESGDQSLISEGVTALAERAPQFRGSAWEEEVWEKYILPNYQTCAELLHSSNAAAADSIKILNSVLEKNSNNVNANIFIIRLITASGKSLGKLQLLCRRLAANSASQGVALFASALQESANALSVAGMKEEAAEVLRLLLQQNDNELFAYKLGNILLEPSRLPVKAKADYEETLKLVEKFPNLKLLLTTQLRAARTRLEIVEYSEIPQTEYLKEILNSRRAVEAVGGEDGVRIGFLASALRDANEFYREMIGKNIDWSQLQRDRDVSVAFDTLNIEKVLFEPGEKNTVRIKLELKSANPRSLEKQYITLEFDKNLQLQFADINVPPEQEGHAKILVRLLETACLEEIAERIDSQYIGLADEALNKDNKALAELRAQVDKHFGSEKPAELKGLEGLKERNFKILSRLIEGMPKLEAKPVFPGKDEVQGLIARYIELIASCRDLERPTGEDGNYRSIVSDANPMFLFTKYLKIFGDESAKKKLEATQIDTNDLSEIWGSTENKNNFSGYYELVCFFPDLEEVSIAVFLDQDGIAHIPGLDRSNPLYNHLWMITLESLALKVVPELKPFAKLIRGKQPRKNKIPNFNIPPENDESLSPITIRKRVCCTQLMVKGAEKGDRSTGDSLAELDNITSAFNIVELTDKDVTKWPIFLREGRKFIKLTGLFVREDDKVFLDPVKLREVSSEIQIEGNEMMAIEGISQEIREKLAESLRIKILNGRAYRMPVDFKIPEHEIFVGDDGIEYFMVPAGNKRGKTIERNGQLFRLVKVPEHEKVQIGNIQYHAMPWQMSSEQVDVYQETSTIKINFEPTPVVYFVLYNKKTGEVVAKACPGSSEDETDNGGEKKIKRFMEAHERGQFACFLDERIKAELSARKGDLEEAVFTVNTSMGYRQGVFPKLWKYLNSGKSARDAAVRLLIDTMKQKLDSVEYREFVDKIGDEEVVELDEPADVEPSSGLEAIIPKSRKPREKKAPKPSSAQKVRAAEKAEVFKDEADTRPYRLTSGPGSAKYAGLAGTDLYIVHNKHPMFAEYTRMIDLNDGEVIVLINGNKGRPSKCQRSVLGLKDSTSAKKEFRTDYED